MTLLLLLLASSDASLVRLLEREADVFVDKPGLARLPLPAEVLSAARPDLGDIRLYDASGREIVYVIDAGDLTFSKRSSVPLGVAAASRERAERSDGPPIFRESYELRGRHSGRFTLVIDSPLRRFVRRLSIVSVEGSSSNTVLDGVSVFRLPEMDAARIRVPIELSGQARLVARIEGEDDGFLEPRFTLEQEEQWGGGRDLEIAFEEAHIVERDQGTVVTVERPSGVVANALVLSSATDLFDRAVRVYDESLAHGERLIGSGRVFRVGGFVPVEELGIPLGGARGERLRIEIEDGDSPALAGVVLRGLVRQPSLVFMAPRGGNEAAAILRFGGGRARRPRYDVSALIPPAGASVTGKRGEVLERLFRPDATTRARLGSSRKNPQFDAEPALAFAMRPGSVVDVRKFTHRRAVTVGASREGLSRLWLGPEDLAIAREDLADVRLVDRTGKQWPYLLEARAAELWRPLGAPPPAVHDKRSRFRWVDEHAPMSVDALDLVVGQGFVDRAFRLLVQDASGGERELSSGRLSKPAGSKKPIPLRFAHTRAHAIVLEVEDRDDAPLELAEVRARYRPAHVYAAAAPGSYFLFVGAPGEAAPVYELERARETILSVRASDASLEALVPNPDYTVAAKLEDSGTALELGLWAAIALAVLVLGALTFRLARQSEV